MKFPLAAHDRTDRAYRYCQGETNLLFAKKRILCAVLCFLLTLTAGLGADSDGLLAEWKLDEGEGEVARDGSGKWPDAKIHGAQWAKQGKRFVLSFDGINDYVDCGTLGINGPITIEAWIKPTRKANGESNILGHDMHSFVLTYYNTEVCNLYIGGGGNSVRGKLLLGEWNHVVASFDGKFKQVWVNGKLASKLESSVTSYESEDKHFIMATSGKADNTRFKGFISNVRLYDRPLTPEQIIAHFRAEAPEYGYEPIWFTRVKVTPFYYADKGQMVIEADYTQLLPMKGASKITVTLTETNDPNRIVLQETLPNPPANGIGEVKLP